jgi:NAD(P)-dependent dehydrogenase (short-subunit alcohol dehydrogenase family)
VNEDVGMKMDGKTVLITGSTDGVGRYVAAKLAAAGAKILIHGRDKERAASLVDEIRDQGHDVPIFYQADLASLAGARQLAEAVTAEHKRLDVFISNAGIGSRSLGSERRTSADGHELRRDARRHLFDRREQPGADMACRVSDR